MDGKPQGARMGKAGEMSHGGLVALGKKTSFSAEKKSVFGHPLTEIFRDQGY